MDAQTYSLQHFTDRDGLPSVYLYDMIQHPDGHLWMTGESGLYRFDGHVFEKHKRLANLEGEVVDFQIDNSERFWLKSLNGNFLQLLGDSLIRDPFEIRTNTYTFIELAEAPDGRLFLAKPESVYVADQDSVWQFPADRTDQNLQGRKKFHVWGDSTLLMFTLKGVHAWTGENYAYWPFKDVQLEDGALIVHEDGDRLLVGSSHRLYYFYPADGIIEPAFEAFWPDFAVGLLSAYLDAEKRLWVLLSDGMITLEPDLDGRYTIRRHLSERTMGNIIADHEGNYWMTTEKDGLYFVSRHLLRQLDFQAGNQPIAIVERDAQGRLLIGFEDGRIVLFDAALNVLVDKKISPDRTRLYEVFIDQKGHFHFFTSSCYLECDAQIREVRRNCNGSFKCGHPSNGERLWLGTNRDVCYLKGDKMVPVLNTRTYSILGIDAENAWLGTVDGLYHYRNGKLKLIGQPELQVDIRAIQQDKSGLLWIGTYDQGLIVYDLTQDTVLHHFTTQNGLSSNYCRKIWLDDDSAWLATKRGVNRIYYDSKRIEVIGRDEGLPSLEANDISKIGGHLYVATNRGVVYFPDSIRLWRDPPLLDIKSIRIGERDTSFYPEYRLAHFENNVKIEFVGITFLHAKDVEYAYRMEGVDKDWNYSKVGVAQYPALLPGRHRFRLKTRTYNTDWSEEKQMTFHIAKPFWKTLWFMVLMALMIGGLGLWLGYLWVQNANRRGKVERQLKATQLTALRAQMNPHFVFNALNSIQEFILSNDSREANRYLSQFARLMRNVLNFSETSRISLEKELETLRLYLSLEALRLGDQFNYEIQIHPGIDIQKSLIPPLLLQPFVENAIKHGLMHKNGPKNLYIRFYPQGKMLFCEIEDDGVGREKSMEIRQQNPKIYPSKAISLTQERLELLSAISDGTMSVKVIDLYDTSGAATGTRVILSVAEIA